MRLHRPIIWFAVACLGLFLLVPLSLPSGPHREPVPSTVIVQGLSRPEAEFLYGQARQILRRLWSDALLHLKFKAAWFRFQDARYSYIQSLTKKPEDSVSIIVVHSWPGKPPYTQEMRTTGNWPWKGTL